jgi:hypothetical protein
MLFPYRYIAHPLEQMQDFVDFIFHEVWCKAPDAEYGIHLYESNECLHRIMAELIRLDLAGKMKDGSAAKFFYDGVNEIFNEFKMLTEDEIADYTLKFDANNKIEALCNGDDGLMPVTYESLNPAKAALNKKIGEFFKKLYSSGFFDLQIVKENIGVTLGDYYRSFVRNNDDGVCPFCGILPIDGEYDPTREAFDHYLPKSKYPFNSVNLKNLSPSCNKCNSGNKRDKDPLHDEQNHRRKAFFPFCEEQPHIDISVSIKEKKWSTLTPETVTVGIHSADFPDETDTWNKLFYIEQRYAAKCCNKNGGLYWLNRVINEHQNYRLSRQEMLEAEIQSAAASPWTDANFLKKAFLEGCNQAGLFNAMQQQQNEA